MNKVMKAFSRKNGIEHTTTSPYNPQSNGIVVKMNQTLMSKAIPMMFQANLDDGFWGQAVTHAAYIHNRITSKVLRGKTQMEIYTGEKPNVDNIRIFGCSAHGKVKDTKKTERRSLKMIYVGMQSNSVYTLQDIENGKLHQIRHVKFVISDKTKFPGCIFDEKEGSDSDYETESGSDVSEEYQNDEETDAESEVSFTNMSSENIYDEQFNREEDAITTIDVTNGEPMDQRDETDPDERQYPQRKRKQTEFYAAVSNASKTTDTPTLKMDLESENNDLWQAAIKKELDALNERKTWEVVERPEGKPVLPLKMVMKIKSNADGSVDKYKARLVVLGCHQDETQYEETFSPVVDFTTCRMLLTIAVLKKVYVPHIDITGSFLYADLSEEIYMRSIKEIDDLDGKVCKLKKSLYGLEQAPKIWHELLASVLIGLGFKKRQNAECAYRKGSGDDTVYLLVVPCKPAGFYEGTRGGARL